MNFRQLSLRTLFALVAISAMTVVCYRLLFPHPLTTFTPKAYVIDSTNSLPPAFLVWFENTDGEIISGVAAFGNSRPQIMVDHSDRTIRVPAIHPDIIEIPVDEYLYILDQNLELHKTDTKTKTVAESWRNYAKWGQPLAPEIEKNAWP